MTKAGDGSQNAPVRAPAASDEIANEAKRWVEYAIGEAISFKLAVSAAVDAAVISARSALSEVLSASSDSIQEAQDLGKLVKNEYTAYEDLVVEKIKEGIYVAASHPGLSSAVIGGVGLVVLKRPRSFLIQNTRRLFLSEESMLADAESKVNELQQSINLVKNESRKLEERAIKAEEEMEQVHKALIVEGRGIQAELQFVRKIEREILGLKDLIHKLPHREASRCRSMSLERLRSPSYLRQHHGLDRLALVNQALLQAGCEVWLPLDPGSRGRSMEDWLQNKIRII